MANVGDNNSDLNARNKTSNGRVKWVRYRLCNRFNDYK